MLKILLAILKAFPQGLAMLNEYSKAQSAATEKALADYKLKAMDDAATIERLTGEAIRWRQDADRLATESIRIAAQIRLKDAEIERLQNETQNRLRAVAAMPSEELFNASLSRPRRATD